MNIPAKPPLEMLDPASIKVDANTYQFRSHGDGNGVTEDGRFKADRWDPILHGDPILVHQRLDGSYYVADGHHRLELAKRLNAQGKGPGAISTQVLREADGYTPRDVRVIAAFKNMSHGHADTVDAARVFKEAVNGNVHMELLPQLQMDKGNLKLSYSLSKLSDKALDQVATGQVPVEMAARVVEQIASPVMQDNVMEIIGQKLQQRYAPVPQYAMRMNFSVQPVNMQPSFAAQVMQRRMANQTQLGLN